MSENTIITFKRREQLCLITSGAISTLAPVTGIAFGSGGVDSEGSPIPPAIDVDSLNTELGRYPLDSITYPLDPARRTTARYVATIPADDLVGASISEAALFDANGELCAIKTMFVKRKDGGVTFTFTFDDEF
ncbi:MAG: phage tail protein [Defluviitaleaceae bacterium]|nr:phage tail protein [Defluviitaleaceae bacterium]